MSEAKIYRNPLLFYNSPQVGDGKSMVREACPQDTSTPRQKRYHLVNFLAASRLWFIRRNLTRLLNRAAGDHQSGVAAVGYHRDGRADAGKYNNIGSSFWAFTMLSGDYNRKGIVQECFIKRTLSTF